MPVRAQPLLQNLSEKEDPEHEAKRFEVQVKEGAILLSVHSDSAEWTKRAEEILRHTGAQDISSTGEASADYVRSERDTVAPSV